MSGYSKTATLFRGGAVLNPGLADRVREADVLVEGGRIIEVRPGIETVRECEEIDCAGKLVMPGFVQTHVHACQTLWRNMSDDMALMEWLHKWTWPLEAAHDAATMRASARLAFAELLLSGTTCINDMGTVAHTDVIIEEARAMGICGQFSRVLMDDHDGPPSMRDDASEAVSEAVDLAKRYHDRAKGTLVALAPRFAASSSLRLLEAVAAAAEETGLAVHTHCAETVGEVDLTKDRFGMRPVALYQALGMMNRRMLLAHCVVTSAAEHEVISQGGASVLHCPSTNLKLGSGIAPVTSMIAAGIRVTLGADGAPCNNNLSMFREARTASLLQKGLHGPTSLPAWEVLRMATIEGATALGIDDLTGSLEPGKRADLLVLDPGRCNSVPHRDPAAAIVYSMDASNVSHVMAGGRIVVRDGALTVADQDEIVAKAREASDILLKRAGRKGY